MTATHGPARPTWARSSTCPDPTRCGFTVVIWRDDGPYVAAHTGVHPRRSPVLICLSACLALLLSACGGTANPAAGPAPDHLASTAARITNPAVSSDDATALAAGNLAFGVDLYAQLAAHTSGNFIYSQTSISLALAMVYAGAANQTAAQMATALHFTLPPAQLHPAFDALDLALAAPPAGSDASAFRLALANSTWVQKGLQVVPTFLDLLARDYGAGLFVEDFARAPEPARGAINGWVSDHTEKMIPELLPQGAISAATRLVLANAVFFHGDWAAPFAHPSPTGTFHAPTGDVSVPMMSGAEPAATWSGAGYSATALPYAGGTASMVIIVPDAGTFATFEAGLTSAALTTMVTPAQTETALITLPKFGFSTNTSLFDALSALGMTDAFSPGTADFSGIDGARDLFVSNVIHEAVIAVDEQGTTAAAATAVVVTTTSIIVNPKVLVIDRPFLFFIRHDPTGAILFQGRVVNPSV
jgi:serpin B